MACFGGVSIDGHWSLTAGSLCGLGYHRAGSKGKDQSGPHIPTRAARSVRSSSQSIRSSAKARAPDAPGWGATPCRPSGEEAFLRALEHPRPADAGRGEPPTLRGEAGVDRAGNHP